MFARYITSLDCQYTVYHSHCHYHTICMHKYLKQQKNGKFKLVLCKSCVYRSGMKISEVTKRSALKIFHQYHDNKGFSRDNGIMYFDLIMANPYHNTSRGVDRLSQLPDILTYMYFHYSCPAPHILCIQFSFNLPDIHQIYQTVSCMTGCFHIPIYMSHNYMCLFNRLYLTLNVDIFQPDVVKLSSPTKTKSQSNSSERQDWAGLDYSCCY